MQTKHVLLIPVIKTGPCHPDNISRDEKYLSVSFRHVLAAVILDGYTDDSNSLSEVYQIAYDNFYTHVSSNVPYHEEEVATYITTLSELAWVYINQYLGDLEYIPKPDFIFINDLPDDSFSVEFLYNA